MKLPHLLITNDDGIDAPGLIELVQSLKGRFRITVVAPDEERSASSLSITIRTPLLVKKVEMEGADAYSVKGTPVDAVKLGLYGILKEKPDLIVSGINPGSNTGKSIFFSGTVGCVIAGALRGFPGVAFSTRSSTEPNFAGTTAAASAIITYLLAHPLPPGTFLNVNFPSVGPFKGFKWTRHGGEFWKESPTTEHELSSGEATYWMNLEEYSEETEGDIYWLDQGYVTLVPVSVKEMTDLSLLEERKNIELSHWQK